MFFDRESRAIQSEHDDGDDERLAHSLGLAARLAESLNRERRAPTRADGADAAQSVSLPPEKPPRLFAAPPGQQIVPGVKPPEARADFVHLQHEAERRVAAVLGVPSVFVSEGSNFASSSEAQLQLFAMRTKQLAANLNAVLTAVYQAIYSDEKSSVEVVVSTARSAAALNTLFASGLLSREATVPLVLSALGVGEAGIESEMRRMEKVAQAEVKRDEAVALAEAAAPVADVDSAASDAGGSEAGGA